MDTVPVQYCIYRFLGFVADVVDTLGTMVGVVPTTRPASDYEPSDVDHLTNEELEALPRRPSLSAEAGVELYDDNILRLTDGTVLKWVEAKDEGEPSEAAALDMVFRHTTIPVPRVRRILSRGTEKGIVMDYIRGRQLAHVWPTMSFFQRLRVGFLLRRYIRQLRAIRHPRSAIPGPLGPGLAARECESLIFGTRKPERGPFASYADLAAFWNERNQMAKEIDIGLWKISPDKAEAFHREPFDDSMPLVLTHGDLYMRNVLVGDDGRLWLLDWGMSGFYPPWFEFAIMRYQAFAVVQPVEMDSFWERLMPFICGPYFHQEQWRAVAAPGLDYLTAKEYQEYQEYQ